MCLRPQPSEAMRVTFARWATDTGRRYSYRSTDSGIAGVRAAIRASGVPLDFETLFGDWTVANNLDDSEQVGPEGGRPYGYQGFDINPAAPHETKTTYPTEGNGTVQDLAAESIALDYDGEAALLSVELYGDGLVGRLVLNGPGNEVRVEVLEQVGLRLSGRVGGFGGRYEKAALVVANPTLAPIAYS